MWLECSANEEQDDERNNAYSTPRHLLYETSQIQEDADVPELNPISDAFVDFFASINVAYREALC